jgi:cell division septation protein DedD
MRDFAPKPKRNNNHRALTWLMNLALIGLVCFGGYLITGVILKKFHNKQPTHPITVRAAKPQPKKKTFDFYSILPNISVPAAPTALINQDYQHSAFYLQVAVTTSQVGAQNLLEKLGTEGYSAINQQIPNRTPKTYKVLIGPFNSKKDAQLNQQLLSNNQIKSLLIKPSTAINTNKKT